MSDFDIMAKDTIQFHFLKDVLDGDNVSFKVYLESDGAEKDFLNIRSESGIYRFNNFNVSEDSAQGTVSFRPIVVGCYMYFQVMTDRELKFDIVRKETTTAAGEFVLPAGESKIELVPQGLQKYEMRIESAGEEERKMNLQIQEMKEKNDQLLDQKSHLAEQMDKLQKEYDKNYAEFQAELEELKGKYEIDEEILRMYAGKDITPIEDLLSRAESVIGEMEEQMRNFITAQQKKTSEIEDELKIGKKE